MFSCVVRRYLDKQCNQKIALEKTDLVVVEWAVFDTFDVRMVYRDLRVASLPVVVTVDTGHLPLMEVVVNVVVAHRQTMLAWPTVVSLSPSLPYSSKWVRVVMNYGKARPLLQEDCHHHRDAFLAIDLSSGLSWE
jgi:hypothetical protein